MIGEVIEAAVLPCRQLNEAMAEAYRAAEAIKDKTISDRDATIVELRQIITNVRENRDATIKDLRLQISELHKVLNRKPNANVLERK